MTEKQAMTATPDSRPSRQERREAERRRLKTVTIRPARAGDAGSLLIPPGTTTVIQELAKGIRLKKFVLPDED